MAFVPVALAVAGAAVSAYGVYQQGQAQSAALQAQARAANYQAQVSANNQKIAEQNAQYAIASGMRKAEDQSMKNAAEAGMTKAAQGASGIDVNTGSAVDVRASQREIGQLDAETVLSNAQLTAYGYRTQGANYQAQSNLYGMESAADKEGASAAETAGAIGAAGSLLSSASSLGFKWAGYQGGGTYDPSWSDTTVVPG